MQYCLNLLELIRTWSCLASELEVVFRSILANSLLPRLRSCWKTKALCQSSKTPNRIFSRVPISIVWMCICGEASPGPITKSLFVSKLTMSPRSLFIVQTSSVPLIAPFTDVSLFFLVGLSFEEVCCLKNLVNHSKSVQSACL